MNGEGILSSPYRLIKGLAKKNMRQGMPPQMKKLLEKYGDKRIMRIQVCRNPLNNVLQKLGNVLTLANLDRVMNELGYDNLFHLYIILFLDNNTDLLLEKNQVVKLTETITPPQESIMIDVNKDITLNQFIENGIKLLHTKFWLYDVRTYNCQNFVYSLLLASGLLNETAKDFIYQDAEKLLPKWIGDAANVVTDMAAVVDTVQNGEGEKNNIITNTRFCRF